MSRDTEANLARLCSTSASSLHYDPLIVEQNVESNRFGIWMDRCSGHWLPLAHCFLSRQGGCSETSVSHGQVGQVKPNSQTGRIISRRMTWERYSLDADVSY